MNIGDIQSYFDGFDDMYEYDNITARFNDTNWMVIFSNGSHNCMITEELCESMMLTDALKKYLIKTFNIKIKKINDWKHRVEKLRHKE